MNKQLVLALVRDALAQSIETTRVSIDKTRKQAIEAPGAMESKSDTTKAQMSQVADSLQGGYEASIQSLHDLEALIANPPPASTKVANYSLVEVRDGEDGSNEMFFILPAGGGNAYEIEGEEVMIISNGSPIATALIGRFVGDVIPIKIPNGIRRVSIISVS